MKKIAVISKDRKWLSFSKEALANSAIFEVLYFQSDEYDIVIQKNDFDLILFDIDSFDLEKIKNFISFIKAKKHIRWLPIINENKLFLLEALEGISHHTPFIKGQSKLFFIHNIKNALKWKLFYNEKEDHYFLPNDEACKFLDRIPILIAMLNSERKIVRTNSYFTDYTRKAKSHLYGKQIGEAFDCIYYLNHPENCENNKICEGCPLRKIILSTYEDEIEYTKEEVVLKVLENNIFQEKYYCISTRLIQDHFEYKVAVLIEDVNELVNLKKEKQYTLERYKKIIENSPFGIAEIGEDYNIKIVNPAVSQRFGLEPEKMLGKKISDYIPKEIMEKRYQMAIKAKYTDKPVEIIDERDGRIIQSLVIPILDEKPNSVLVISNDITKQKRSERLLKESEDRFRKLSEMTFEGIVIHKYGKIIDLNKKAEELIGYTREEMLGKDIISSVIVPDFHMKVRENIQKNIAKPYEVQIQRKDGSLLWVEIEARNVAYNSESFRVAAVRDVTERRRIQRELLESRQNLNSIIENMSEALVIAQDEFLVFNNRQMEYLIGYTSDELLSRPFSDFIFSEDQDLVIKHHRERISGKNIINRYDFRIVTKNGEIRWVQISAAFFEWNYQPATINMLTDITDRKLFEEKLRQSEEKFRLISENTSDGIMVFNEGKVVYLSPAYKRIMDYDVESSLGFSMKDVFKQIYNDDRKKITNKVINAIKNQLDFIKYTYRIKNKKGRFIWREDSSTLVYDQNGKFKTAYVIARDVTEQKKKDEELIKAKIEADKANQAKSDFLASMSHEIRTPMNAIIGMTDLAIMTPNEIEKDEHLSIVKSSAQHLLSVINDILDISKIESGKMELENINYELSEVIISAYNIFQKEIESRGLLYQLDINENIPEMIHGDPTRLRQVVVNLLGNAIKFTEKGKITLSAQLIPAFQGNSKKEDNVDYVEVSVLDTGVGIPQDIQKTIFDDFAQADFSISRKYGGTGLGLSISKKIIHLMNGKIGLESKPGEGSRFFIQFPVSKSLDKSSSPLQNKNSNKKNNTFSKAKYHILLAEDNEINVLLTSKVLSNIGHKVDVVHDGNEVIHTLLNFEKDKSSESFYDLVLMDIEMPEMDGIETTKLIRKGKAGKKAVDIPIIAMSAHAVSDIQSKAIEVGMNGYIAKPVEITKLQMKINEILEK